MLIVISPAKNLDFASPLPTKKNSKAKLLNESEHLISDLKQLAPHQICKLMGISDKLGMLNYDRYQAWTQPFSPANARPAVLAFKGDVYLGLNAYNFSDDDFAFAQSHLRILSGLYGLLRPLDLMQAYRLEMGTKLTNVRGRDLYQFWGDIITRSLNQQVKKLQTDTVINLASQEYFKSVQPDKLSAKIITPVFKDWKNGQYKIISFFAKKARGLMSAYIIKNKITDSQKLTEFCSDGYQFNNNLSSDNQWVFTRKII